MVKAKIIKSTTVRVHAQYGKQKQTHLVDYVPNEKIEAVELIQQNNPKIIKLKLADGDFMTILKEVCEIIESS